VTRKVVLTGADLSIILPGSWAVIPLQGLDQASSRISALIKKQLGRNDRLAGMRRELKQSLIESVKEALDIGAVGLAISLEILPGVPFPASLVILPLDWSPTESDSTGTAAQRLMAAYPGSELIDDSPERPVVRRHELVRTTYETETSTDLKINYWLPVADGSSLARVYVKAPMAHTPELWLELFDTIIGSLGWLNRDNSNDDIADAAVEPEGAAHG
jgi:hypothetical protein